MLRYAFGVNMARSRYYLLLVRRDYLKGDLESIVVQTLKDLESKFDGHREPWWGPQEFCVLFHKFRGCPVMLNAS